MTHPSIPTRNPFPRVEVIAHRGASGDAPENTLASFELALAQGADGIEFDVHLSRDNVPMVIHDARLERTTPGAGRVAAHSAAALARLDAGSWFNRRFPSRAREDYRACRVPLLEEVLAWVRLQRCRAYIEIKQTRPRYRSIHESVLEQVYRAGVQSQLTIISFHLPTLRRIRRLDSRLALGIDFVRPLLAISRARRISAGALLPHWRSATRRWIARAHRAGLKVVVWGLDDPRWMPRKIADGADGMITSYPALLREIVDATAGV
ncbi:MAG TPA: glycerophosphodiester phosphodiesterase family protein [Terriglobia bacterium]|nr:glycerophosphodiester phosphodiesterase family protein [Terriglobia bacterium]